MESNIHARTNTSTKCTRESRYLALFQEGSRVQGGNSIALEKGPKKAQKRPEKGPKSKFATSICMNSEKEPGL